MGYETKFRGRVAIAPPLTADELRDLAEYIRPATGWPARDVCIDVNEEDFDLPDGTHTVRLGLGIVAAAQTFKGYDIEDHLRGLVDRVTAAGHDTHGYIVGYGDELGDVWRLKVDRGKVRRETARLVWPDGTEVVPA